MDSSELSTAEEDSIGVFVTEPLSSISCWKNLPVTKRIRKVMSHNKLTPKQEAPQSQNSLLEVGDIKLLAPPPSPVSLNGVKLSSPSTLVQNFSAGVQESIFLVDRRIDPR
jgi:hypothetical protein